MDTLCCGRSTFSNLGNLVCYPLLYIHWYNMKINDHGVAVLVHVQGCSMKFDFVSQAHAGMFTGAGRSLDSLHRIPLSRTVVCLLCTVKHSIFGDFGRETSHLKLDYT